MSSRPLQAVLLPSRDAGRRMLESLSAALDGTGPAILPLDPSLPQARIDKLITAFGPSSGVADDVAVVLPTSGSTGVPKGAELSAQALLASARASLDRLGAAPGDRWLCCLPIHHISGLGVLVRSLASGTELVIRDRVDAGMLASGAEDLRCSYVSLVPTQLRRLLDAGAHLAGFRAILLGGAAIPAGMLEEAAAAGARVVTSYGMTETCGGCVYDGVPLDGVQVAAGADGAIKIAGPVLFSGYRLAPKLTSTVLRDGWFTTADLGEVTAAGRLVVRGRADDVINTGGEKVVASEVEQALCRCPGVREAVIVGIPDRDWGERVTAVIVPADTGAPPGLEVLQGYVRDQLPRHAAPNAAVFVSELPLLASGKPDRQLIRDIAAIKVASDSELLLRSAAHLGVFVGGACLAGAVAKTQFYTATSIDGFIADQDNSLDWLFQAGTSSGKERNFSRFFADVGAMAMGATTYEWAVEHERLLEDPGKWQQWYGSVPCWIFTHRRLPAVPGADLVFASDDVRGVHEKMTTAAAGKNRWLVGGGDLVGQFADLGLLDEILLEIAPAILGKGTPLLPRHLLASDLNLASVDSDARFVFLTYQMRRREGQRPVLPE